MECGKCYNCGYLDRYYTKGIKKFDKTKLGWCCKKLNTVTTDGGCEDFKYKKKPRRNRMLKLALNDLLIEISEIRKVLEAENENL